jgi:hypothetical protein
LNKVFLQWSKNFPSADHTNWLHTSMSSGGGGRRFPSDIEFGDAIKNQPQYGRGATRFVLCCLENAIPHKEPVDLAVATIEHVLPQTLSSEWKSALGADADKIHARLVDTFGNLTLTGYNAELGNLPFSSKRDQLRTSHIELNRWIVEQESWGEGQIVDRAELLLEEAKRLWIAPLSSTEV